MSTSYESDLLEIFAFIDSDTLADGDWLRKHLAKQCLNFGLPQIHLGYRTASSLKAQLIQAILSTSKPIELADLKVMSVRIRNAWRVKKHRKSKRLVNLSIGLQPEVAAQLTRMCVGHKKNEIVTKLIQENYKGFLEDQKEIELKKLQAKKIREKQKFDIGFQKLVVKPTEIHFANTLKRINERKDLAKKIIDLVEAADTPEARVLEELLKLAKELYEKAA